MRTQKNYGGLDRFRIIAALLVVAIHTSPLAALSEGADFFLTRILARIAVPFFFMVTGQFVAAGLLTRSVKSTARFHKFLLKTGLLYLFCILLYLPIGIYAEHYQDITFGSALRMLIFDGTFYHLWYFPACILGIGLVRLMSLFLDLKGMTAVSALLYVIGLLGDSYYGLVQKVPMLEGIYDFGFTIFSYTRNGLFLAPLFLVMGMWAARAHEEEEQGDISLPTCCTGLALSFLMMTVEGFLLRHFQLQRHDSMYLSLIPVMYFLYQLLLWFRVESKKGFRTAAMWIYILHPAFIVVVRGLARPLHLTELLVENNLVHYFAVAVLSTAAAFFVTFLQGKVNLSRLLSPPAGNRAGGKSRTASKSGTGSVRRKTRFQEEDTQEQQLYSDYEDWDADEFPGTADEADMPFPEEVPGFDEESLEELEDLENMEEMDDISDMDDIGDMGDIADTGDTDDREPDFSVDEPEEDISVMQQKAPRRVRLAGRQKQEPRKSIPAGPIDSSMRNTMAESTVGSDAETQQDESACSRAWIELSPDALEQNVAFFLSRLPHGCRLMPAVKADAYGHGIIQISRMLSRLGVSAFCVACISEGIVLRKAGIPGEILILGYTAPKDFPLLRKYRLTQTVVDYAYARRMNQFGERLHVHIGIDTGMHRIGIRCENIEEITAVYQMENLKVDGVFTHLCASDSPHPDHRAFTYSQIQAFYQVIDILKEEGCPCPGLHLLASYGILNLLPDRAAREQAIQASPVRAGLDPKCLAADYVRPGIALYGVLSTQTDQNIWKDSLMPVLSLKAKVTSLRTLHAGESVGYGITYTAEQDMQIAAVAIGYADGLPRELSNGRGYVLINGRRAPFIGRICMDQSIVDVTGIPKIRSGDDAVVIGRSGKEEITAAQIAEQCGTITHEILTGLAARLGRVEGPRSRNKL